LFLISFGLHALGSFAEFNQERLQHGGVPVGWSEFLGGARFWFESFQNWQSEFLAIGSMVVLSIWLRQKGSPESKPVDAPHTETGAGQERPAPVRSRRPPRARRPSPAA
jgi:hypothetical protein